MTDLRRFLDKLPAAAFLCDREGLITYFNRPAVKVWGREPALNDPADRYCGPVRLFAPDGPPIAADQCGMARALQTGQELDGEEIVIERPDNSRITVLAQASPIRNEAGEVTGAINILVDISDRKRAGDATVRKRAAEELQRSEERFTRFTRHLPGLAWIKDLQGRYLFVNDAAERAFQKSRAEICGRTDHEIFPPETADKFSQNDRLARDNPAGLETVETLLHGDGVVHHSLVTKFPIPGADGQPALIGGMAIDITARMQAEEALRDADRRKDEFLAMLAHELRNPLAPLSNSLQILRLTDDLSPAVEAMRDVMQRQVDHLVRLVDDLLEVSRITRGKVELRKEPVELAAIVAGAVETSRPLIEAAGHQLAVAICPEPVTVDADPVRLGQVISNLLNNAAKFTEDGGQIWLSARAEQGRAVISVRDTGVGIPAEMLPKIFDMFAQLDGSIRRAHGGLGIGLNLAKSLVEMHGGTIEARSDGPSRGSEFTVRLPLVAAAPRIAPGRIERRELLDKFPRHQVLVVDDAPAAAQMLAKLLEKLGQDVRTALSATDALQLVAQAPPDVVISDLGMPRVDGLELARRLRAIPAMRTATLVALTGYGQDSDKQRTKEAGFDQHLVKPVNLETLQGLLQSLPAPKKSEPASA